MRFCNLLCKNGTLFSDLKAILAVGFIKKEKGPKSIYINHNHSFLFDSITAEPLNRSWQKWYHMKALLMLCVYSHES